MTLATSVPAQARPARPALIGEMLIAQGKASEADVAQALSFQEAHGGRLGAILVRMGALSEEALLPVLSAQLGFAQLDPEAFPLEQLEISDEADDLDAGLDARTPGAAVARCTAVRCRSAGTDPLDLDLADALAERVPGER